MDKNNPNNLTPEQIKQGYSTIAGAYNPVTGKLKSTESSLTATNPTNTNVLAPNLNNVNQLQLPQTQVQTTPTVLPQSMADRAIFDTQKALEATPTQDLQSDLISKKMNAILGMNDLGTEAQVKQEELIKQGYQKKLQEYNTLNSQILQKQAEITQINDNAFIDSLKEERRDTLLPFAQMGQAKIQADKEILLARRNSDIYTLNAQVLAKQGDIQLAQQMAQDAVDVKFAPFKAQIQMHDDLLKALDPLLTRDEKRQANEQQLRGQIALKEIDKVSDYQKTILSNAISSNAPQSVINAISKGQSIEEITKAGAGYLQSAKDKLELQKLNNDIAKTNAEFKSLSVASPVTEKVNATMTLKGLISDLASGTGKKGAVGMGLQKFIPGFIKPGESQFLPGTKAAGYETTFNQLKDTLAFENISKLKGAMSDKDIAFLRNIGTKLSLGMSEKEFNKELLNLDKKMNEVLLQNGVDPTVINSYSAYSNDELLALPQAETSNSNFFNR